jgi:AcrR family transcriptional regulator
LARDEDIRKAAAELFYRRGFAAVGVDEIGVAAGVTGPAIYRHFNGKDEILASLFDEGMDEIVRVTGGTFDDPQEELEHLIREHARSVLKDTHLASVWTREDRSLVEPYRRRYQRRAQRYFARWFDCISRCYPDASQEDVTTAVYAVLGLLNSIPSWPPAARKADNLLESIVDLAVGGLRSLARTRTVS